MNIFWGVFQTWNRLTIIGMIMVVVGLILTPVIIGIPILIAGFLIGGAGIWYGIYKTIIRFIPGGEEKIKKLKQDIIESYKPYFRRVKQEN